MIALTDMVYEKVRKDVRACGDKSADEYAVN